jgi:hypothetical protein
LSSVVDGDKNYDFLMPLGLFGMAPLIGDDASDFFVLEYTLLPSSRLNSSVLDVTILGRQLKERILLKRLLNFMMK